MNEKRIDTKKMVLGAIMTALVIILQLMGAFIKFGPFSISLVLIPIVIGAAECGVAIGAWLGFVFGVVVLASGDAAAFLSVDAIGTVITVLLKGTLCGFAAGLVYRAFEKINRYAAVVCAAVVCPLVNTGVFLLGCIIFFMDTLSVWAGGADVWKYMIFVLVGWNFLFELGSNIVLSPVIVRLLNLRNK
ncbi:MAG: ECF transporter S component [Clostridia bacterium]|nr:ECF transporter S component [Clostridia bacterium]